MLTSRKHKPQIKFDMILWNRISPNKMNLCGQVFSFLYLLFFFALYNFLSELCVITKLMSLSVSKHHLGSDVNFKGNTEWKKNQEQPQLYQLIAWEGGIASSCIDEVCAGRSDRRYVSTQQCPNSLSTYNNKILAVQRSQS